jgi:hypothetical protein
MDFEMSAAAANGNTSDAQARAALGTERRQSPNAGGRKGNGVGGQGQAPWGNNVPPNSKETASNLNIPGTSTFSANPNANSAQPPKRRKNAAAHAANAAHAKDGAPSHAQARRANNAMVPANSSRESNMMTFEKTGAFLREGKLEADDGKKIAVNDQVYLVCEPPGEPYYLCRIMEFLHVNGDPNARVDSMRVNWYYRPRDVQRFTNDTRLVYATMHSDVCPITSLRGLCKILHRSEIGDLDEYRKTKDSFWFNQVFDRFIHRWYDVIPTSQVINVPANVKKALDERWKYICVETSRVKELTSAVKLCKRCVAFCATNDSVECAVCHNTYHMNCVRPPLLKKPSRGFAWACAPCSRAQEKRLEARRTPLLGAGANDDADEEEPLDEEEEEPTVPTTAPSPSGSDAHAIDTHPGTQAEIALAKMWPMRYLGIHCRLEDALQYDDRAIYPRASSRLGPRHQANVNVWHGRPVELVKPAEIKKRYVKSAGHKKDTKLSKETVAAMEADKAERARRPKWVLDEPPGYVHRGEDHPNKDPKCTAELQFKMPPLGVHSTRGEDDAPTVTPEQVEAYMTRARALAGEVGVKDYSTNFLDKCLCLFMKYNYDAEAALKQVKKINRQKDLHEPELTKEEEKKWNEGVAKYGSEIRSVRLHVKTISHAVAVRYYYMWKKTPKGREIWGSYSNRKGKNKKTETDPAARLLDDVADDQDDSAFDSSKAQQRKRGFQCKFCSTRSCRQWRRAPGVVAGQTMSADGKSNAKDKSGMFVVALCLRCANLWRKYAVKWENTDEIAKKVAQGGGKAWKRRIDEELLREVYAASTEGSSMNGTPDYMDVSPAPAQAAVEPPKKKQKTTSVEKDSGTATLTQDPVPKRKEKEKVAPPPKAPTPPPVPAPPRERVLPCAVCRQFEFAADTRLVCQSCKLTVHKACYGIQDVRHAGKWACDTCKNDRHERVSYNYECVLCPVTFTEQELFEPPKVSHKKKTDREREKERLEKELVDKAREQYRHNQEQRGRPVIPREPLKRTADNNWIHVYCALWHPETKFGNAHGLDIVEGVGAPTFRYDQICKICKSTKGACVSCHQCHANFHVGCAHNAGYTFGFDITPVKATRRDAIPTVTINGETGSMTAAIWCKEHPTKGTVHTMNEQVEGTNMTALQLFAREFKQADLTLTGTARKANLVDQSTRLVPQVPIPSQTNRRTSTTTNQTPTTSRGRQSIAGLTIKEEEGAPSSKPERKCARCMVDASPRWWKVEEPAAPVQNSSVPPRVVDGVTVMNGVDHVGPRSSENTPRLEETPSLNGPGNHRISDAPAPLSQDGPPRLGIDTDVVALRAVEYLCQKCHWKKNNAPEDPPEQETSRPIQEPQQLPLRSPPVQTYVPPPLGAAPWLAAGVSLPAQQPPIPTWHGSHGHHHPPPLSNGIGHPPPPPAPPLHHPPPYHYTPMHPQNGYPPYSGAVGHPPLPPTAHPSMPPNVLRPYPSISGPPPPLSLHSGPMIINGMHSPHLPYSPTHAPGPASSRPNENPFAGPAQLPQYPPMHHGSPVHGPLNTRPSTPRDTVMREAPVATAPPENRISTGASASPSLRNLIH